MEEEGELGGRAGLGHAVERVEPVAVDPQGIRPHHPVQQRVAFRTLESQGIVTYDK